MNATVSHEPADWSDLPAGTTEWLGATPMEKDGKAGTNFCFYAGKEATGVEVCLFDKAQGECKEVHLILRAKEEVWNDAHTQVLGYKWHGFAEGVTEGRLYGFRVHGPYRPENRLYFNANKLLVDPAAKAVTHEIHQWEPRHFPHNFENNGFIMPKARVVDWRRLQQEAQRVPANGHPEGFVKPGALHVHTDSIIAEMHVGDDSRGIDEIPIELQGKFLALLHPAMQKLIEDEEFTTLEWLPIESYGTDSPQAEKGLRNRWGYMTMAPMAPHTEYTTEGGKPEIECMQTIRGLKQKSIEVILDVVPNHTLESGRGGPVVNLRGMDDFLYLGYDCTGTGNTRDFGHPINRELFLQELKYWKGIGVSGFRIDLANVLGRVNGNGFDHDSPMMKILREDPDLKNVKLYGEPWDCHQVVKRYLHRTSTNRDPEKLREWHRGEQAIAEWNHEARDVLKQAALGHDTVPRSALMHALAGSDGDFAGPQFHVNVLTTHDFATLFDETTYSIKNNTANGQDNTDGNEIPLGRQWPTVEERMRVARLAVTLLGVAQGVPLMTMDTVTNQSYDGNTNPFVHIPRTPWRKRIEDHGWDLMALIREMNHYRRQHSAYRRGRQLTGQVDEQSPYPGMKDITWFDEHGKELTTDQQKNSPGGLAMMLSGEPGNTPDEQVPVRRVQHAHDTPQLVLINTTKEDMEFTLPPIEGLRWEPRLDSLGPQNRNGGWEPGKQTVHVGKKSAIIMEGQKISMGMAGGSEGHFFSNSGHPMAAGPSL